MKAAFLLMLVPLLCSCGVFYDQAIAANGNKETIIYPFIGGTSTLTGANGAHFTHDHQQSLRDVMTAAGTAYAAGQAAKTTINAANNTTTQQLNQQNFQLGQQTLQNQAAKTLGQQTLAKDFLDKNGTLPPKP